LPRTCSSSRTPIGLRALELKTEQGLIERRHGKGTFVRAGLSGAPMLRFFRFGAGDGKVPQSRILARQSFRASAEVARRLGIARGDPVLRLHRLRSLCGQPSRGPVEEKSAFEFPILGLLEERRVTFGLSLCDQKLGAVCQSGLNLQAPQVQRSRTTKHRLRHCDLEVVWWCTEKPGSEASTDSDWTRALVAIGRRRTH